VAEADPILIVDDNEKNLYSLSRLLESSGHRTVCVNSGQRALQKLLVQPFALILLDVQMPEIDGFETARLIKAREKTRNIPILFITAVRKEEGFVNTGFQLGAVDYITKPVDPNLLQNKVQVFLRLHQQEQELALLNNTLEERVMERTRALQSANASLQHEISVRQKTEEKLELLVSELETKNSELAKAEETVRELNADLGRRVEERTAQLKSTQKELLEKAHKAGMADIASGVLHNVGNILSSVITSGEIIKQNLASSKLLSFSSANGLLRQNMHRYKDFFSIDPKGERLLSHYLALEGKLVNEQKMYQTDVERILDKAALIRDVVMAQQDYATGGFQSEMLKLDDCVEDALKIQEADIRLYRVEIVKHFKPTPKLFIQRGKTIHILVNLLKNAREATLEKKRIVIRVEKKGELAYIAITDSGRGIAAENLNRIFSHGFTTKKGGHGFGLHSCAIAMMEMGGRMWAESDGIGKGASFILEFPCKQQEDAHPLVKDFGFASDQGRAGVGAPTV